MLYIEGDAGWLAVMWVVGAVGVGMAIFDYNAVDQGNRLSLVIAAVTVRFGKEAIPGTP